jgi:hypothetical protein
MILALILLAILAAVTGMLVREGLWRSLLMFFNVLAAAAIATAWYAPLATFLEGHLASYTYLLDFLSIWLIFCVVLALAREATDRLSPNTVEFPQLVERVGVGIPAFFTGWVMMAFTAATLHLAPLTRGDVQPTPEAKMFFLGLAPDRAWLGWVRGSSRSGPFSRGQDRDGNDRVFDKDADFILRYADRRLKLEREEGLRAAAK